MIPRSAACVRGSPGETVGQPGLGEMLLLSAEEQWLLTLTASQAATKPLL